MLLVYSCMAPLQVSKTEGPGEESLGTLVLSVVEGGRTLSPTLNMDVGSYKVVLKKGAVEKTSDLAAGASLSISLEAGDWTLQVDAYNKDAVPVKIGTGSAAFTIQVGKSVAVPVTVVPLTGNGTLELGAVWTGLGLASPKVEGLLTAKGSSVPVKHLFTVTGESASLNLTTVAAGYYTLKVDLYDGTKLVHSGVEAVRIVAGASTKGTFAFSGTVGEGSVSLVVSVDLKIPMQVSISGIGDSVKIGTPIALKAASDKAGVTWEWMLNGQTVGTSSDTLNLVTGVGAGALGVGTYRVDALASKDGVLSSTHKIFTVVNEVIPPTVSAVPGTSEFQTASVEVTLNAANPASGQYQIGTGSWVDFSSGTKVILGASLNSGESVVLNLKNGEASASYTYTKKLTSGLTIGYKASAAPTIWLWETTGAKRAIMTLEKHVWPGPNMAAAADVEGYFTFTIPQSYLPVGDLAFKFNGSATEIALTAADIAAGKTWWDGTKWITKPAPQPQKPSIALTPDDLYFDPSVAVTITVTDGALGGATTASYTLNGSAPVTIAGGKATVNLTATSTIVVNASNLAGTSTVTRTYTKGAAPAVNFTWDNASVYFVITDRFYNGNTANDNSYGRPKVDATGKNIGTFHGGDIAGLTQKLNAGYFNDLGVNALWITAPYEQAHGWVGGGSDGDFAHYAYHGYYALDFSNIDANMGTKEEFKTFVRTAHSKGVRVILDIVMNHSGYPTLADMKDFGFKPVKSGGNLDWTPGSGQNWFGYHDAVIDYNNGTEWGKFWGQPWVRAGLAGYDAPGGDDLTKTLAFLPDFKTENATAVGLPEFLKNKTTYGGAFSSYTVNKTKTQRVRDWQIEWLTQWVKEYGIDGFRVDTAKHVEMEAWTALKSASNAALAAWRQAEAAKPLADRDAGWNWTDDFWMTAEVWGHGPNKSNYHTSGAFDSVINFNFQGTVGSMLGNAGSAVSTWGSYASAQNPDSTWASLSYISSHDTGAVFYNGQDLRQQQAGTALMLLPGGVQIFYGDELGRVNGNGGSDKDQGSRSSVDWAKSGNAIHQHWQKVGQFRRNNLAVGAGTQAALTSSSGTAVSRTWSKNGSTNKVAIVMGATGTAEVQVGSLWTDGTTVRNAYTGATATVTGGKVSFAAGAVDGLILIEKN